MRITVKILLRSIVALCMIIGFTPAIAECGIASTYSSGSQTANGERYIHTGVSAAHKTLPFGTVVDVCNKRSKNCILVRINDRGPFIDGRIIDLSTGAKRLFGMDGLASVCLEVVHRGHGRRARDFDE
jgi:rare lipoprotein A